MGSLIAIAGNIGSGKSTLSHFLSKEYNIKPYFEPNDENPFLKLFYKDMKAWSFHSQLFFLSKKFEYQKELEKLLKKNTVVQDRTIYEDAEIFAQFLFKKKCISKHEWQLYQSLYQSITEYLQPPDLLICIDAPVRILKKRIKMRGRKEEKNITDSYLRKLNSLYTAWFSGWNKSKRIRLEIDKVNYLEDLVDQINFRKNIEKYL